MAESVLFDYEVKGNGKSQPDAESVDGSDFGTRVNGTVPCDDREVDVPDGFTDYFKNLHGTYKPRECEKESWGADIDQRVEPDDQQEKMYQLVKSTAPRGRWREGLFNILRGNKSETSVRKCLTFLHSNVFSGIKAAEAGCGELVDIEVNSAPECLTCPDWMIVMEGLNLEVTSPGAVRNIEFIDVVVGKETDKNALTGFCYLIKALLDLSWTNLQTIHRCKEKEGLILYKTLTMLYSGCGIDESDRSDIEELENKYPALMKSLGFRRSNKHARLQWQLPEPEKEFRLLCLVFHGLFRSADSIESAL